MNKLPKRFEHPVAACLMSGLVASVISGVQTALFSGLDGGFALRWLGASGMAFPIAFTTAFFAAPLVKKLTARPIGS